MTTYSSSMVSLNFWFHYDGLTQNCGISSASTIQLCCTKLSIHPILRLVEITLMVEHKTVVSPLLTHRRYHSHAQRSKCYFNAVGYSLFVPLAWERMTSQSTLANRCWFSEWHEITLVKKVTVAVSMAERCCVVMTWHIRKQNNI